jgi:hypothetical protein
MNAREDGFREHRDRALNALFVLILICRNPAMSANTRFKLSGSGKTPCCLSHNEQLPRVARWRTSARRLALSCLTRFVGTSEKRRREKPHAEARETKSVVLGVRSHRLS